MDSLNEIEARREQAEHEEHVRRERRRAWGDVLDWTLMFVVVSTFVYVIVGWQ